MSLKTTAVALRCPRCESLYDSGSEHQCDDGKGKDPIVVLTTEPGDDLCGAVIGERYSVLDRLTAGGMGVVYRAKHVLLDAEVAIKILLKPQDPDAQYRFLQEAQLASKIRHPNTVYISDFGLLPDGRSYIVMEFLRGPTLGQEISRGKLGAQRTCQIGLQIARGLQAVHDKGIIHRDLKPDNIFLIEQDGQKDFVKIVDFGIATNTGGPTINVKIEGIDPNSTEAQRALKERHTLPGTVLGTPHYMSPEQALGDDVDPRADQYALGCILFEMLTGVVPFDDDNAAALMFMHAYRPPPQVGEMVPEQKLPESLCAIVMRTLAKKREDRFASMRDLEQALLGEIEHWGIPSGPQRRQSAANIPLLEAGPERQPTVTETVPLAPRQTAKRWPLMLVALIVGIGGGLLGYLQFRQQRAAQTIRLEPQQILALRAEAIETLKQDLLNPDIELRQGATTALGATYDRGLAPLLAALLTDKEAAVRVHTAEVLGQLGQPTVVPQLAALLDSSAAQPVVAVAAAEALDQLGDARGQKALRQALAGKHDGARLRAALYLCGRGDLEAQKLLQAAVRKVADDGAITILLRLAQAGDSTARDSLLTRLASTQNREQELTLASNLGKIGEPRGREILREQAKRSGQQQLRAAALLAALDEPVDAELFRGVLAKRNANPAARTLAANGLSYVGATSDLPQLEPLLKDDKQPRVRQAVAVAMVRISDADPSLAASESLTWAQDGTNDPNWLLRDEAVAALGDLQGQEGVATLIKLFNKRDSDPNLRRQAAQALGRRRDSGAQRALREGLADSDSGVRLATQAALLAQGDEAQRAPLQTALQSGDEAVRRQVVESVDRDRELLASALVDKAVPVRRLAARKLANLGDKRAVPVLRETTSEQSSGVEGLKSYAALRRLGESAEPPPGANTLLANQDPNIRSAALEAVTAQGGDNARPALEKAARDPDRSVRLKVAELAADLGQSGSAALPPPPAAIRLLKQLARDLDGAVRARASALLLRLQAPISRSPEPVVKPPAETKLVVDAGVAPRATPSDAATSEDAATSPETPVIPDKPTGEGSNEAGTSSKPHVESPPTSRFTRETALSIFQAGSDAFKKKDYRKTQKTLERLSTQCSREAPKVCAPISYDLSYFLGRSYEAEGQFAEAMNEFQRLEGLRAGSGAQRTYLTDAVKRMGKKLGRVQVNRLRKGRCETTFLWVTPGEQEIRLSASEKQTVKVSANQKTTVGTCK